MDPALESLLQHRQIWRGGSRPAERPLPSGHAWLDPYLPGGGWPDAALTELIVDSYGLGELRLLLPALVRPAAGLSGPADDEPAWVAWVAPPCIPYAPALAAAGLDLGRVLVVQADRKTDGLWAAEQLLRSGLCAAVLVWAEHADQRSLRRLQLAAEQGTSRALLFRRPRAGAARSFAALRLHLCGGDEGVRLLINDKEILFPPDVRV